MKTQIFRNNAFCAPGVLRYARWRGSTAAGVLLAAGALGVLAPAPVVADDVAAGIDVWRTPPGSTASVTIPADFFGPGSDPFDGPIAVQGEPFPGQDFDTVIARLEPAVLVGCPAQATIDVEIVALSLVSSAPFTATRNGGQDPEDYVVHVCLSDCHSLALPDALCPGLTAGDLLGGMTIHHDCPAGGTFDSSFPVYAKFTFTPVGGGPDLVLDVGREGLPPETIETGTPLGRWSHDAGGFSVVVLAPGLQVDGDCDGVDDAPLPGTSNFVPGIGPASCTCGAVATAGAPVQCGSLTFEGRHEVLTGKTAAASVGCCLDNGWCMETSDLQCSEKTNVSVLAGTCQKPELCLLNGAWQMIDPSCCECQGGVPSQEKTGLTALLLGNTNYDAACLPDLPGVIGDVLNKQSALDNAGWGIVVAPNQAQQQMAEEINNRIPASEDYIVWYAGHGDTAAEGALVGTDCVNLTPQEFVDALKDATGRTLVILDSCGSGAFADAVNLIDPTIGFITAATGLQCVGEDAQKGFFSRCFVEGLNGLADANADGLVTVAEAAAYAIATCAFTGQDPTWDGDHADWVIGVTKEKPALCDGKTAGCWSGCITCEDPGCTELPEDLTLLQETNFTPVHLALVKATLKINRFQEAVTEILMKQKPPPKKIVKINNVQDAIAAIIDDFNKQGAGNVVMFGHGSPGHFKIGDKDDLADPDVQDKFTNALAGMFKTLTLYGCEVGKGAEGQAFLKKLTKGLKRPVHTWTGKVYAFPNKWPNGGAVPPELANGFFIEDDTDKKEIPAVTEWGMVVMVLLVLAAGTVVIRRARAVTAQA